MQTPRRYVFDTSVLIAFSSLRRLSLLCEVYPEIIIPEAVRDEFDEFLPGCSSVIKVDHLLVGFLQTQNNIGAGEAAVITHCLNYEGSATCFIDDKKARKIAKSFQLKVSGTIGILMKMEEMGLLSSAYTEALKLKHNGFHISNEILRSLERNKKM